MNRLQDDANTLAKVNKIVQERLPSFASRYFKDNIHSKAPRTLLAYARDLTEFFDFLEIKNFEVKKMNISGLNKITPEIIEDYLDYIQELKTRGHIKYRSYATIKRKYCSLSAFLDYYYTKSMIDNNPATRVIAPKVSKQVTDISLIKSNEDIHDIISFIANDSFDGRKGIFRKKTQTRDLAIIMLLYGAGLKISDVVNLNIEDVHLDTHTLLIKGRKKRREVYYSDTIALALGQYLSERLEVITEKGHDEALFISLQCKRISIRTIQQMIKKYSDAAFEGKTHLTSESLHQAFRDNIFTYSRNVALTSAICGIDIETLAQYYHYYLMGGNFPERL